MASDGMSPEERKAAIRASLTEEDLRLGKRASKFIDVLCVASFVACIGIAAFVFSHVPWDTRMPYDGKYNRSGTGIPMQIAMVPCLIVLVGFWRSGRKPDAHQMTKAGRIGLYILGSGIVLGCAVVQWAMATGILIAGGYLSG